MWLSFYNPVGIGDVLVLTGGELTRDLTATESQSDITRIYNKETGETKGFNIQNISNYFVPQGKGHVYLSREQKEKLNQLLYEYGFDPIELKDDSRLVLAKVQEVVPHPNSDHLTITQTVVDDTNEALQIVCGAQNVYEQMLSVAALPGAVLPNGQIIWEGDLRGVHSVGMLCSAYELGIDPEHIVKGIIDVQENFEVGTPFEQVREQLIKQVEEQIEAQHEG